MIVISIWVSVLHRPLCCLSFHDIFFFLFSREFKVLAVWVGLLELLFYILIDLKTITIANIIIVIWRNLPLEYARRNVLDLIFFSLFLIYLPFILRMGFRCFLLIIGIMYIYFVSIFSRTLVLSIKTHINAVILSQFIPLFLVPKDRCRLALSWLCLLMLIYLASWSRTNKIISCILTNPTRLKLSVDPDRQFLKSHPLSIVII